MKYLPFLLLILVGCNRKAIPTYTEKTVFIDKITVDTSLHAIPGKSLHFTNKSDCPPMLIFGKSDKMETSIIVDKEGKMTVDTKAYADTVPVYTPKKEMISDSKTSNTKIVYRTPKILYYLIVFAFALGFVSRFFKLKLL
jgi:hypothetical protein